MCPPRSTPVNFHERHLTRPQKPRDDEYHFTERAQKLIDAWNPKGSDSKSNGDAKTAEVTDGTAAMNLNGTGACWRSRALAVWLTRVLFFSLLATPAAEEDAKGEADADAPAEVDTENVGDESMLADVTMSEAP